MTLKDGSELVGETEAGGWTVDSAMGRVTVDLADVVSTNLEKTTLRDGSVLRGRVRVESIPLRAQFGDFDIKADKVASVSFPGVAGKDVSRKVAALPTEPRERADPAGGLKGMMGVGMDLSTVELGLGPIARYWVTDHIGAQAGYIAVGGFTGYSVRGLYAFNRELSVAGNAFVPYAGAGYMSASKTEDQFGIKTEASGSGPTVFAGLHGNCFGLSPHLFCTTEFMYAAVKLTATATIPGPPRVSAQVTESFSDFTIGFSMAYYFSPRALLANLGHGSARSSSGGGQAWH